MGGIPYVVFVDASRNIVTDHLGLWTNTEEMSSIWNETLAICSQDPRSTLFIDRHWLVRRVVQMRSLLFSLPM